MTRLTRDNGPDLDNPSRSQILDVLQQVEYGDEAFVVLEADQGFIQAAKATDGGLLLEYGLADAGRIHRITSGSLAPEQAADVFEHFGRGELDWAAAYTWEDEPVAAEPTGGGRGGCLGVLVLVPLTGGWIAVMG